MSGVAASLEALKVASHHTFFHSMLPLLLSSSSVLASSIHLIERRGQRP